MRQAGRYSSILVGGISGRTGPHALPLARIKRIMKRNSSASGEVAPRMISGEAPVVFSKACEMLIQELARRGWEEALRAKRRTLLKEDVASAVAHTDVFDFLLPVVEAEDGPPPPPPAAAP
ncbi:nuclear transcription factor Y subunit C-3-like [Curcuma longa]|uniref:nuclear transcription factor Y subunit C-3-like n=1 Tax=Curcuma longa TaxID=136217 RepID=UPI003D9E5E4F